MCICYSTFKATFVNLLFFIWYAARLPLVEDKISQIASPQSFINLRSIVEGVAGAG